MRALAVGSLSVAAVVAALGASLYFQDGTGKLASAFRNESPPAVSPQGAATSASAPEAPGRLTVIGRWEDRIGASWTQEIRIVEQAGQIVRELSLPDGKVDRDILTEVTPRANERKRFVNPSSMRGQAYAITRHGHLAIFDDDGLVHQATKITTSGEQP